MNKKDEELIIRYLLADGASYSQYLSIDMFSDIYLKVIFGTLKSYVREYDDKIDFQLFSFYMKRRLSINKIDIETWKLLSLLLRNLMEQPRLSDTGPIRDHVVQLSLKRSLNNTFKDIATTVNQDRDISDLDIDVMVGKINATKHLMLSSKFDGIFLMRDFATIGKDLSVGTPTYLQQLNLLTSANGFYTPQLIVLMAGPKKFKTGIMLNIALKFQLSGLNVFYADFENGADLLAVRLKQSMGNLKRHEVYLPENQAKLSWVHRQYQRFGGEMVIKQYKAHKDTLESVENDLNILRDVHNFTPDVILYDYLDLVEASPEQLRLKIQMNYHKSISINKEFGCFAFTVSKVNKGAVNKEKLDETDFGEDFAKGYNAHAVFAVMQTEEEAVEKVARIVPVLQRDGVSGSHGRFCPIAIDAEKQRVTEIFLDDY